MRAYIYWRSSEKAKGKDYLVLEMSEQHVILIRRLIEAGLYHAGKSLKKRELNAIRKFAKITNPQRFHPKGE